MRLPNDESRLSSDRYAAIRAAALDHTRVQGLTHKFYRYPARFSPQFAAAAIEQFTCPGGLVLDPYMGGATSVVESLRLGRRAVGCDVNSLSVFLAKAKTTALTQSERGALKQWAEDVVPSLLYSYTPADIADVICEHRTKNLNLPLARPIKKVLALAIRTLDESLPSSDSRNFARCVLLNVGQWALNGRKRATPLVEFREELSKTVLRMLEGLTEFENSLTGRMSKPYLINDSAVNLADHAPFDSELADCAITSPPYPGVHMLYHRWQVDGRRESPAPYWLANCHDGQGATFYNFADRREQAIETYFDTSLKTLKSIRTVLKDGATFVQMIAFGDPDAHLPRYLENMAIAGFEELRSKGKRHIKRRVPSRKWHASLQGKSHGASEVVLIHRAK